MSTSLRDVGRRADAVAPPTFDIDGIVERGDQRRRRHRAAVAAGAVAVVAAAVIAGVVLAPSERRTDRPAHDPIPPAPHVSTRSLTWSDDYREKWDPAPEWLIQSIRYGDRRLRTGIDALQMDVTDDGVALTTEDGGVYFADGSTVERIGTVEQYPTWSSTGVESGNAGSLVAWFDPAGHSAPPTLVVYDTHDRRVVAEREVRQCSREECPLMAVVGDRVYADDPVDYYDHNDGTRNRILVFDTSSGELRATDAQALWDDRRARPRALVKSTTYRTGEVVDVDAYLVPRGHTLALRWLDDETGPDVDGDGRGDGETVYGYGGYDSTGRRLDLRLPRGYTPTASYRLFQWLDDDRFAVIGAVGDGSLPEVSADRGYGEILVCDIAAGRCDPRADGPDEGYRLVPDLDAPN